MKRTMTVKYDEPSDTLYIDACPPYGEQESNEIARGVVVRMNPRTGKIENIEVLTFRERFATGTAFELPISLDMESAQTA